MWGCGMRTVSSALCMGVATAVLATAAVAGAAAASAGDSPAGFYYGTDSWNVSGTGSW